MADATPARIPTIISIESRFGNQNTDAKAVNCITTVTPSGEKWTSKRPGYQLAYSGTPGTGQGMTNYLNNLYTVSGDFLNAFSSSSTLTATLATSAASFPIREEAMTVGFNGKIYVLGGRSATASLSDVWSSVDGVSWSQVTASAPWGPRSGGQAIVFNGTLFVISGQNFATGAYYNDVWSSSDGVNWTQVTTFAFTGRTRFAVTIFNNQLWVAGGAGAPASNPGYTNTKYSDIYSSTTGAAWTKVNASCPWVARSDFAFFSLNNRLHVVGGAMTDAFTSATSDAWSTADGITWTRDSSNPFGQAGSALWPVAAFNSYGVDFPIPAPITVGSGTATAYGFTDFDDDGDDDDLNVGQYVQLTFGNTGSGYTSAPAISAGTSVGFNVNAYAFLDGTATTGSKWCTAINTGSIVYILEFAYNGGTFDHVLWTTTDGTTFTNVGVNFAAGWTPRYGSFFYYGKMWMIAGVSQTSTLYNDVWYINSTANTYALNPSVANGFYYFNQTSRVLSNPLLVFKSTNDLYTFNAALATLAHLTPANYPATTVPGLVVLDTYFFVMDPQGRIWNSSTNDPTTWNALSFISMQNEPNGGVALAKLANYVVAFGQWTTEFFFDAGTSTPPASPLQPNTTLPINVGCASGQSVREMQDSIVWIGQTKEEGQGVYMFQSNQPVRISTPYIDQIIQNDPLTNVRIFNLDAAGWSHYGVTLVTTGVTLVYNFATKTWHVWTSLTPNTAVTVQSLTCDPYGLVTANATSHGLSDGDPVTIGGASTAGYNGLFNAQVLSPDQFQYIVPTTLGANAGTASATSYAQGPFLAVASAQVLDNDYIQDPSNGNVYFQDSAIFLDGANPINVDIVTTRYDAGTTEWKFCRRLSLGADIAASNCMVAYTDNDYQSYSSFRAVSLNLGQRPTIPSVGRFRRRAFRIRHTAATEFRVMYVELELIKGGF